VGDKEQVSQGAKVKAATETAAPEVAGDIHPVGFGPSNMGFSAFF